MKARAGNHGQGEGGAARPGAHESKLIEARMQLAEQDQATRVKGITALGRIKDPEALITAVHAFQACVTGPENFAAQRSIVQLCAVFQERAPETAVTLVTLISAQAKNGRLMLVSEEFTKSCDTVKAVLSHSTLNNDVQGRIDEAIDSWYERIKGDFNAAPNDVTLADPRELAPFKDNSMPEADRRAMFAVQSMAMLAELMEGIQTPKATEIKKELLEQISPNGFGDYVLRTLSAQRDPEIQDAVQQVLERWGRSHSTPTNRFVMACTALTEMFRSQSAR
jgi:hypothetical protein